MDVFANLALGFGVAFSPINLGLCLIGALVGTLVGVLPGIGTIATVAMLLPITAKVADIARAAQASGADMSPGEVVNLTMKCHEFMFHCQLSSSIANRTSDGIQQLFRQQS